MYYIGKHGGDKTDTSHIGGKTIDLINPLSSLKVILQLSQVEAQLLRILRLLNIAL